MSNLEVAKKNISKFVRDAMEMETAIFTLHRMEDECLDKQDEIMEKANSAVKAAENCLYEKKRALSDLESEIRVAKYKHVPKFESNDLLLAIVLIFPLFLPCLTVSVTIFAVFASLLGTEIPIVPACIVAVVLALVAGFAISIRNVSKERKKITNERDTKIANAKKEAMTAEIAVKNAEHQLTVAKKGRDKANKICTLLDLQAYNIEQKREEIEENLKKLYAYGIIPPDYRHLDCVIMLDQIFRNDLADTMRQAIMMYEERVRHGEVIKGLDKICTMLDNLSQGMSAISYRLDNINRNVTQMGEDLYRFNENIVSHNRTMLNETIKNRELTRELIDETKLGRYSMEQLNESNKRLAYYAEEYRMGRMPNT